MDKLNYSRQREALLAKISGRTDHPTADTLYSELRNDDPHISLGTVYRNLALLSKMGKIRRIPSPDGNDRFDYNTEKHYHFICKNCGTVVDIWPNGPEMNLGNIPDSIGSIDTFVMSGLCSKCKNKAQNRR